MLQNTFLKINQYLSQNHSEPINKLNKKVSTNIELPSRTGIATDQSRLWEIFMVLDSFFAQKRPENKQFCPCLDALVSIKKVTDGTKR